MKLLKATTIWIDYTKMHSKKNTVKTILGRHLSILSGVL